MGFLFLLDRVVAVMTFAEWILFAVIGYLLYRSLFPLQRRIEASLLRFFNRGGKRGNKVIDITDYNKQTSSKKKTEKENDPHGE